MKWKISAGYEKVFTISESKGNIQAAGSREERHSNTFLAIGNISLQQSQCSLETRVENKKSFGIQGLQEARERSEKHTEMVFMKAPEDDRN